jgi:DNA-binding Lrp family transcriptional regulator
MTSANLVNNILCSSGFFLVNKSIAQQVGLLAANLLSLLIDKRSYWASRNSLQEDGSFFWNVEEIDEVIGCTKEERLKLQKKLVTAGVLKIVKRGLPSRNYYLIDDKVVLDMASKPVIYKKSNDIISGLEIQTTRRPEIQTLLSTTSPNTTIGAEVDSNQDNKSVQVLADRCKVSARYIYIIYTNYTQVYLTHLANRTQVGGQVSRKNVVSKAYIVFIYILYIVSLHVLAH